MSKNNVIEFKKCGCDCGENISRKSMYKPGHDARHAGRIAREVVAGGPESLIGELPTDALRSKASKMVDRLKNKPTKVRSAAVAGQVKVGRWSKAATRAADGTVTYVPKQGADPIEANAKITATFTAE